MIQERTSDGVEVVEFFLKVFRGQLTVLGSDGDIAPSIKERMEAGKWLADRAWGLPAQPVTGEDGGPVAVRVVKYGEGD